MTSRLSILKSFFENKATAYIEIRAIYSIFASNRLAIGKLAVYNAFSTRKNIKCPLTYKFGAVADTKRKQSTILLRNKYTRLLI